MKAEAGSPLLRWSVMKVDDLVHERHLLNNSMNDCVSVYVCTRVPRCVIGCSCVSALSGECRWSFLSSSPGSLVRPSLSQVLNWHQQSCYLLSLSRVIRAPSSSQEAASWLRGHLSTSHTDNNNIFFQTSDLKNDKLPLHYYLFGPMASRQIYELNHSLHDSDVKSVYHVFMASDRGEL